MNTVTFPSLGKNGRLGNQLFQIAATYSYAKDNDLKFKIPLWRSEFLNTNSGGSVDDCIHYHEQQSHHYQHFSIPKFENKNVALHGYFQCYKYFHKYEKEIQRLLYLPQVIESHNVSIHIRRGDYGSKFLLDMEYYKKAIEYFNNLGYHHFMVFSDDSTWAMEHFKGSQYFHHMCSEIKDLTAMIGCQHHIIANSTFSFWGAYLNNHNPNKIVVRPEDWKWDTIAGIEHSKEDITPPNWIKL